MPFLVAIFVALLVAGGVLLAASVMSARRDQAESPLRSAVTGRDEADDAAAEQPVDLSLAEFLTATVESGDPYMQVDDLAATLQGAASKAAAVLPGLRG